MCLAVLQPIGKRLTDDQIVNAWAKNPDNGGFAFVNDKNVIEIHKYDNLIDFLNYYDQYVDLYGDKSPFLVHLRLATHGTIDLNNTHPFFITNRLAMIHNGIIDIKIPKKLKSRISDTRYFIDTVLKPLPKNWVHNKAIRDLIDYRINDYGSNKLVFLNDKKETFIVGESQGHWLNGLWFSNTSYKAPIIKQADIDTAIGQTYANYSDSWDAIGQAWDEQAWDDDYNCTDTLINAYINHVNDHYGRRIDR